MSALGIGPPPPANYIPKFQCLTNHTSSWSSQKHSLPSSKMPRDFCPHCLPQGVWRGTERWVRGADGVVDRGADSSVDPLTLLRGRLCSISLDPQQHRHQEIACVTPPGLILISIGTQTGSTSCPWRPEATGARGNLRVGSSCPAGALQQRPGGPSSAL